MSDEQFEEFLKRNAGDYNAPPSAAPRDEMWAAIAEARATARASARASAPGAAPAAAPTGGIVALDARRSPRRLAPWIGMAATLLIGIGIGRFVINTPTPATVAQADSLTNGSTTQPASGSLDNASLDNASVVSGAADTSLDAGREIVAPDAPLRQQFRAPAAQLASATPTRRPNGAAPAEPNTAFTLASREHLQRAEALVSVVAATPADAVMDSLTGKWAREMLVNTRLLLDSPAGDDPLRRRLLEDLETVLVQLVQRSGAASEEREILDRTLQRTQLLTRLRTGAAGI